jgi:hypothetical protein
VLELQELGAGQVCKLTRVFDRDGILFPMCDENRHRTEAGQLRAQVVIAQAAPERLLRALLHRKGRELECPVGFDEVAGHGEGEAVAPVGEIELLTEGRHFWAFRRREEACLELRPGAGVRRGRREQRQSLDVVRVAQSIQKRKETAERVADDREPLLAEGLAHRVEVGEMFGDPARRHADVEWRPPPAALVIIKKPSGGGRRLIKLRSKIVMGSPWASVEHHGDLWSAADFKRKKLCPSDLHHGLLSEKPEKSRIYYEDAKESNMKLPGFERLERIGFVGERKALALLSLSFYVTLFFLMMLSARTELPEWLPLFTGLFFVYLIAFVGVAAEWFWGRWFGTGLGYWGLTMAGMGVVTSRTLSPPLIFFGLTHGLVAIGLWGPKMAAVFEAKPGWRERYKLDDAAVVKVRRLVTRAASSIPALIIFALMPRESVGWVALSLAVLGIGGVLLLRTWGVFALVGAAAVGLLPAWRLWTASLPYVEAGWKTGVGWRLLYLLGLEGLSWPIFALSGLFAVALLLAATVPLMGSMLRYLGRGRR